MSKQRGFISIPSPAGGKKGMKRKTGNLLFQTPLEKRGGHFLKTSLHFKWAYCYIIMRDFRRGQGGYAEEKKDTFKNCSSYPLFKGYGTPITGYYRIINKGGGAMRRPSAHHDGGWSANTFTNDTRIAPFHGVVTF